MAQTTAARFFSLAALSLRVRDQYRYRVSFANYTLILKGVSSRRYTVLVCKGSVYVEAKPIEKRNESSGLALATGSRERHMYVVRMGIGARISSWASLSCTPNLSVPNHMGYTKKAVPPDKKREQAVADLPFCRVTCGQVNVCSPALRMS